MTPSARVLILSALGAHTLCACLAPPVDAERTAPRKPHVLVLYTDDQGYGDCSALWAQARFETPHMDRLASEGMLFTDAHSAGSVCTPSRHALLTGQYAWRTGSRGVLGADGPGLIADGQLTLASLLRSEGYTTACFGKWHLGLQVPGTKGERDWSLPVTDGPLDKGFDRFFGLPASMNFGVLTWFDGRYAVAPASAWTRKKFPPAEITTRPLDYRMAPPYEDERQSAGDIEVAPDFVDEEALSIITEQTVSFLQEVAAVRGTPDEQPSFTYVAFTAPHLPHCTAAEFRGRSGMGNYGDFLLETDHRIGQILEALDETGLADETLVVLSSDNGPENNYHDWLRLYGHRSNGPLRGGKRDLYEGGHRVPFIVRWPGVVQRGTRCDAMIGQVDLLATLSDVLGHELEQGEAEDSVSFAPALRGAEFARGTPLVQHSGRGFALRSGDWKWIRRKAHGELFDLEQDPGEQEDLAELRPQLASRLDQVLEQLISTGRSDDSR